MTSEAASVITLCFSDSEHLNDFECISLGQTALTRFLSLSSVELYERTASSLLNKTQIDF